MKRLIIIPLFLITLAFMVSIAGATNWNEVQNGRFIEMTPGTIDWDSTSAQAGSPGTVAHANGMRIASICLTCNPSTANNVVSLYNNVNKNGSGMAHCFPYQVDVTGSGITWYYDPKIAIFPYVKISESTLSNAKLIIQLAPVAP